MILPWSNSKLNPALPIFFVSLQTFFEICDSFILKLQNMKKIFQCLCLSLLLCASCGTRIVESGHSISETRTTPSYNAIEVSDGIEVVLLPDSVGDLKITADANIVDYILTEVVNNTLQISMKDNIKYILHKRICITLPNTGLLTAISVHDGSSFTIHHTTLKASELSISLTDGSGFEGKAEANQVSLATSDGSLFNGNITTNRFSLEASDGSEINCDAVVKSAIMNLRDGSLISIAGSADSCTATLSDGSALNADKFVVNTYSVDASDGAFATINCIGQLNKTTSGGGSVEYVRK